MQMGLISLGRLGVCTPGGNTLRTVLRRKADGKVTVVSAATVRAPILTRNADGTVTVS